MSISIILFFTIVPYLLKIYDIWSLFYVVIKPEKLIERSNTGLQVCSL